LLKELIAPLRDSISEHAPQLMDLKSLQGSVQACIPEDLRETVAEYVKEFVNDKSQGELIFLISIALAVILFAVILPAYEALFGTSEDVESSSLKMYKPGVGVVEVDCDDIAGMSLLRGSSGGSGSASSSLSSTPIDGSSRSIGSHGSGGSMETIEEYEEDEAETPVESEPVAESSHESQVVNRGSRLFVGNLSWDTTSSDLQAHFAQVWGGCVAEVAVTSDGRKKGFGYVSFDSAKFAGAAVAKEAIAKLDGVEFMGRKLEVQLDNPFSVQKLPVMKEDRGYPEEEKKEEEVSPAPTTEEEQEQVPPPPPMSPVSPLTRGASCSALLEDSKMTTKDKVDYYEFLSFLNSASSPSKLTIKEEEVHEENETDFFDALKSASKLLEEQETQEPVVFEKGVVLEDEGSVSSNLTTDSQRSKNSISSIKRKLKKGGRKSLKKLQSSMF
jgi:hypothetical protein